MTTEMLPAALWYIQHGFAIFPCKPRGKTPLTEHGLKDATTEEAVIRRWWETVPESNIAIACGPSGLVVLDSDPRHGGDGSLHDLYAALGIAAFDTPSCETGGGGLHIYFKNDQAIGNSAGKIGAGLDTKGDGGYVIAPPSIHPSGKPYQWAYNFSPRDKPLLLFPEALAAKLRRSSRSAQAMADVILEGRRHDTLVSLAGTMRRRGMSEEAIAAALLEENTARCNPPLDEKEVRAIAHGVAQYPPEKISAIAEEPPPSIGEELPTLESGRNEIPGPKSDGYARLLIPEPSTWATISEALASIKWLWPGWLAMGFLHLLVGESGKGKSSLALRLAATFTESWEWPDGTENGAQPHNVLWAEAESAQALNLTRLKAWGLSAERFLSPFPNPLTDFDVGRPNHRRALESAARREDVALVIVDSLSGACGGKYDENSTEMLRLIHWLAQLARDISKPVLLTHHLRKKGLSDGAEVTLDRIRGSSSITQMCRLAWALDTPDLDQPKILRLSVIKSNLSKFPVPLGLTIEEDGVAFGGAPRPVNLTEAQRGILQDLRENGDSDALAIATRLGRARNHISEDLSRMETKNIVESRREGLTILYHSLSLTGLSGLGGYTGYTGHTGLSPESPVSRERGVGGEHGEQRKEDILYDDDLPPDFPEGWQDRLELPSEEGA